MDHSITMTIADILIWGWAINAPIVAWFLGGYYKTRRKEGMTKDEVITEAKAITSEQAKAWFSVVLKEIQSIKDKVG